MESKRTDIKKDRGSIWDEYEAWLMSIVMDENHKNYIHLLVKLDYIWFYAVVANDDNRTSDGIDLRYDFCDAKDYAYEMVDDELNDPCTVLEMLIALARRCENQLMWDPDKGDRTAVWFWKFIENLGLIDETDDNWNAESDEKVEYLVDNFMARRYFKDGFGGLFPLKNAKKDQRKVEIWYQLQSWLMENYEF